MILATNPSHPDNLSRPPLMVDTIPSKLTFFPKPTSFFKCTQFDIATPPHPQSNSYHATTSIHHLGTRLPQRTTYATNQQYPQLNILPKTSPTIARYFPNPPHLMLFQSAALIYLIIATPRVSSPRD